MYIFIISLSVLLIILLQFHYYLLFGVLLCFLSYIIFLNKNTLTNKKILILILIISLFGIKTHFSIENNNSILKNGTQNYEIEFVDNIFINGDYLKTTAFLKGEKILINYKIKNKEEKEYFLTKFNGGTLLVKGELTDITSSSNFYSFDYKNYSNNNHIYKKLYIEDVDNISYKFSSLKNKIMNFRTKLIKNVSNEITFSKQGYFEAIIYGYKGNLLKEDIENFRNLGISHLLAISGLHIATLIFILSKLLDIFSLSKKARDIIIFIFLPLYSIFAGMQPSVLRACIMIMLFIILKKYKFYSQEALCITFLLLLFYDVYYIFDIGFQYSFFITFSLLMSSEYLREGNYFQKSFKVSLIASLASIPISIINFYSFSLISVFSNLFFVPYFTIIIFPMLLISYFVFSINTNIFNFIFKPILNLIFILNDKVAEFFNNFSFNIIIGKQHNIIFYLIFVLIILMLIFINIKKYKHLLVAILSLIILITATKIFILNKKAEVLNISGKNVYYVKNNKSMLFNTSDNIQDFKKDFSKKFNTYDIMNDYNNLLLYEGIYKIDYLILTKNKARDIGFSRELIGKDKVEELFVIEQIINDKSVKEIISLAKFKNIKINVIKNNTEMYIDDVLLFNKDEIFNIKFLDNYFEINKGK